MAGRDDVCVLVPTYDEAATIGEVIDGFREQGFEHVLVVDGHSSDGTREIAREHGARVVEQSGRGRGRGKGQAVRQGLSLIEQPYVLMIDGDGTYQPADADALLEPLVAGRAEHVIGDRYADMDTAAMTRLNGIGNRLINRAFGLVHGRHLEDVLSGYRAFTTDSARRCSLAASGFGIETELSVECVKQGITTAVVPISYRARPDGSETNLRPVRDGGRILVTLYRLAKTHNPLFYFGSVGTLSTIFGALVGAYVGIEYFTVGISHEALAVVAAFGILFGVQLLMFGVLSDMIVTLNHEQTQQLAEIAGRTPAAERTESGDTTGSNDRPAGPTRRPVTRPRSGSGSEGDIETAWDGGESGSVPSTRSGPDPDPDAGSGAEQADGN
jgi:glycosyltransferase (TIGR04182 family)